MAHCYLEKAVPVKDRNTILSTTARGCRAVTCFKTLLSPQTSLLRTATHPELTTSRLTDPPSYRSSTSGVQETTQKSSDLLSLKNLLQEKLPCGTLRICKVAETNSSPSHHVTSRHDAALTKTLITASELQQKTPRAYCQRLPRQKLK